MKKLIALASFSLLSGSLLAQIPEDVLKYSWGPVNGSARVNAIGGAMGSLGGDITALYVNPAGLGFYKTSDIAISPGFNFFKNKGQFRGTDTTAKDNKFNFGPSGIVIGWPTNRGSNWRSHAFSFGVNRSVNFANSYAYKGLNDFSSYGEQYAAEVAGSGLSLDEVLNSNAVSLGARMAVYSYLVDTARIGGGVDVVSMAMYDQLKNGGDFLVSQEHRVETKGGITDLGIAYAGNLKDKFYIGAALGIPIVSYTKYSTLVESDATGNTANFFSSSQLDERFTTKGAGLNLKLGAILKPTEAVRIGLAIHTPTWYNLRDTYDATMTTNTENYGVNGNPIRVRSTEFTEGVTPTYEYTMSTPWKFMLSGSYVLREIEDVTKQKGFITADIEYVTHKSNRFATANEEQTVDDKNYYDGLNNVIKDYYKNAFNFRVGGELKFTTIMTRLGFAYYGNPYSDKALKANQMYLSGGLGYRNKGIFIDLTYVHALQRDVSFPYRLSDKANTFADIRGSGSNISLTFGFKI